MSGDGAFVDGRVFTGSGYAEAFLVESGRFVAVGTNEEVRRRRPVGCPVHALGGHLVIPGLVDPHLHLTAIVRGGRGVPLRGARDLDELSARVASWGERHPVGPIVGRGWDESEFPGREAPTRREIDRVERDRPVILYRACGHAAAVNSAALEAINVHETPSDLAGGRFGAGSDGRPNGLLYERALDRLQPIVDQMPRVTPAELRVVLEEAATTGLTTVATVNSSPEEVAVLAELVTTRPLSTRIRVYPQADLWRAGTPLPELRVREEERSLVRGLKAITDGSFGARTAWLDSPYVDAPGECGVPVWSDTDLRQLGADAAAQQIPLALHAIGDRALRRALDLFEANPAIPSPRLEHASLVPPSLLEKLGAFSGWAVVQPNFAITDGWVPDRLGSERARGAYAWRTLIDAGVNLAGSSDAPFDVFDPWVGLRAAVDGAPWRRTAPGFAPERLTPEEAVAAYTVGAARALDETGPWGISEGAPADFVRVGAPDLDIAVRPREHVALETWRDGVRVAARPPREGAKAGGV
ncbi:MAG: amidohydrolase [Thermoplasmata archaeon]|nr:amidohydrolase [Thermoplasmata archaeon]